MDIVSKALTRESESRTNDCVEEAARKVQDNQRASQHLGDILYADKSRSAVPEADWVKLVRSIAMGEQAALQSLFMQSYRLVFTLVVRIVADRQIAEEVTLDVFYDVWRKASTYDARNGSVVGWIMNQARCRALDRLRFDQRKKRVNTYPDSLSPATLMPDPQKAAIFEQERGRLKRAMTLLSIEERRVIELAFFGEFSYSQVAEKLNQPLGTVKTRIRSGLNKLRDALAGRPGSE